MAHEYNTPAHQPAPRTGETSRGRFRPDIQGLRAIAVLLVLIYHADLGIIPGGYVGVDAFFVISGFLITGHLLSALRSPGGLRLSGFYARRVRRILPVSLVVIVATVVGAFLTVGPLRLQGILQDAVASAVFVPNIRFALEQTDYLADAAPSPFQHYWSLGVEEQFYLFWPVALMLLFAIERRWPRTRALAVGVGVIVASSLTLCLVLATVAQPWAFFSFPTRTWEFGAGAVVALLAARVAARPDTRLDAGLEARPARRAAHIPPTVAAVGGWIGLGAVVGASLYFTADTAYPGWTTLVPVLGTALLLAGGTALPRVGQPALADPLAPAGQPALAANAAFGPSRFLSLRPLQFVGGISYSLYLVHWPLLVLAEEWTGTDLPPAVTLALAVAAVPLAWLLHRFVEMPARDGTRVKKLRPRFVLAGAVALPGILALSLIGSVPLVASAQLTSNQAAVRAPLVESPLGTGFVPRNIHPALDDATADTGELYTNGCQQTPTDSEAVSCTFGNPDADFTVALFGDSHAGRWFPALEAVAEAHNIRLVTFTKSKCRSIELRGAWTNGPNQSCVDWRMDAAAQLNAEPPDVIILANHTGLTAGTGTASARASWTDGFEYSLSQLPQQSQIVMLADSPEFRDSPVYCLSNHPTDADRCAEPRDDTLNSTLVEIQNEVAAFVGANVIDLTDYFCNTESCPPVIGDTLVYSDEHHITATFSKQLAPALDAALSPFTNLGAFDESVDQLISRC
jgi:peptidoglycan/LPS O-acetylase OafA/YrhL